ncbi:ParB/RepB/Spo0J family partition protein [Anaerotignum faecicola]|nr:ParB/RepB/Spo0J family partition protein [Anaerotignum faecicola]
MLGESIKFYDFFQKKVQNRNDKKVVDIPIEDIKPNPAQPRKYFHKESLEELTSSIKEFGVMQPITVRLINGHCYELVCGERRLRAAKLAGLSTIPAMVVSINDNKSALIALTENIQRQNLNYIEEALGYQSLVEDYGLTQEEVAQKLGKSQSSIANKIRLLRLSDNIKGMLLDNNLTERHARSFLKIPDERVREEVVYQVIQEGLNVKKTEELVNETIEKLRESVIERSDQKIKRNLGDIRLVTNTIKKSVELMKNSGIDAVYKVEEKPEGYEIVISIANKEECRSDDGIAPETAYGI